MNSFYTSEYENKIDFLISQHGNKKMAIGLTAFLNKAYRKEKNWQKYSSRPEEIRNKISTLKNIPRIKVTDLKSITKIIILNLDSSTKRDHALIIYKYLNNAYTGNYYDLKVLDDGIENIRGDHEFPDNKFSKNKEGDDGKYKALSNLFTDDNKEPSDHTIKFGFAILGIDVNNFEELIGHKRERKKTVPILLMLASLVVLTSTYFILTSARPDVNTEYTFNSSQIFNSTQKLKEDELRRDSLVLVINDIIKISKYESIVLLNIFNLSDDIYFPNRIELIVSEKKIVSTEDYDFPKIIEDNSPEIIIDPKRSNSYNIYILNDEQTPNLPPRSQQSLKIKISNNQKLDSEISGRFSISSHSQNNEQTIFSEAFILY